MAALMERQLGELASQGWCLLPGVIPEADVRRVRNSVLRTTAEQRNPSAPESIGHVPGLCCFDRSFALWLASDAVMNLVTALFGPGAKITFCTGQTNYPGCERQEWCAPHPTPPHPPASQLPGRPADGRAALWPSRSDPHPSPYVGCAGTATGPSTRRARRTSAARTTTP
jgi:hypothetical protein